MKSRNSFFQITIFLFIAAFSVSATFAQDIKIKATLKNPSILLGDQTEVKLEMSHLSGYYVHFPLFIPSDTLISEVEIISYSELDTVKEETSSRLTVSQTLTIQAFEAGFFEIPAFKFLYAKNGSLSDTIAGSVDTIISNTMRLEVLGYQFDENMQLDTINTFAELLEYKYDTDSTGIVKLNPLLPTPLTFEEFFYSYGIIIAVIILIAMATVIGYYYYKRRKAQQITVVRQKPKEPAHIIALRELDNLEREKLWQSSQVKEFYIHLTDIMRQYIQNRFNMPAMESTSYEILETFGRTGLINIELQEKIHQLLVTGDFVKFAKSIPKPNENEMNMKNAYDFVLKTKISVAEELKNREENKTEIEQ